MLKLKSIVKEIAQSKFQIIVFMLCLILAIGTFVSIESLKYNVEDFVNRDSKILNGADVIVDSNRAYSDNLTQAINLVREYYDVDIVNSYSFSSVVYAPKTDSSVLSQIRVIGNGYPLYGELILASNKSSFEVLVGENIVVEESLLIRLGLEVGDELKVGDKTLTIADVIVVEPDRPIEFFEIGPRILIPDSNLEEINLVGDKSRVFYETLIRTSSDLESEQILNTINAKVSGRESANFHFDEGNTLERFVLNFLFFIKLIALFIIMMTGISMTSIIMSYIDEKKTSIGIRKSLGEKNKQVVNYYYLTIMMISILSIILSIIFAYLLMNVFPSVFNNIIPQGVEISISLIAIFKGLIIGLVITTLFTLFPLLNLEKIKPIQIFRREEIKLFDRNKNFYLINFSILIFFIIVIFVEVEDFFISFWLVVGSISLFSALFILIKSFLALVSKYKSKIKNLALRQSINGLFRIGNKTNLVITSITLSLLILFTIIFLQINLQNQFVTSFPKNAPNFFVLDVPKENISDVSKIVGNDVEFYPVIRGNLLSVNGVSAREIERNNRFGDSLTRTFSLTYGSLLKSETIEETIEEDNIFSSSWNKNTAQVSVLDETMEMMNAEIGDNLVFLIQGVEIEAEIVSIRTRVEEGINAYFYYTFEEEVLKDAPQNVFTITRVEPSEIPRLQNEIVKKFPQVTVIDGESTAKTIGEIISELSKVVSFFTFFSLGAGVLILLSSIISTNAQRTQEAVFYKLVGSNRFFISKVFLFEYLFIGVISATLAILISSLVTFAITKYFLDIIYIFPIKDAVIYSLLTVLSIMIIGILSSIKVISKKPIEYIRENRVE